MSVLFSVDGIVLFHLKDGGGSNQCPCPARGIGRSNRRSRLCKMPVTYGCGARCNRRRHGGLNLYRALMASCAAIVYFALFWRHGRVLNADDFNLSVVCIHERRLKIQAINAHGLSHVKRDIFFAHQYFFGVADQVIRVNEIHAVLKATTRLGLFKNFVVPRDHRGSKLQVHDEGLIR